jgi:uncharacterized DUF497 family protein
VEPIIIWDLDDDPEGNVSHIAEHGITQEEVEDVLGDPNNDTVASHTSDRPITFGWTRTGKHIAVVWEEAGEDPRMVYPITAYETPPRGG